MELDILSDDFVEIEIFDFGILEINKIFVKMFKFCEVKLWVMFFVILGFV